jgi:ABC-2 type transport system ATP-binding protein
MSEMPSVLTKDLGRVYKIRNNRKEAAQELVALNGVNLEIHQGELFGVLGPNGAGKTTLIKILTTLLAPTRGEACVAGINVAENPAAVRERINMVSGGETSGYGLLTVRENLWMFAQFYGIPSKAAYERIDSLLAIVGMADRRDTKCSDLSTGLRQKMNIVRGFLTDPQILFLDEPTLGLDVAASRDVRSFIQRWMQENRQRSLLLTTHYMAEADELCDRVAIVNRGKVLACDSPAHLKHMLQGEALFQVWVSADGSLDSAGLLAINGVNQAAAQETPEGLRIDLRLQEESVLPAVFNELNRQQRAIFSLQKREPTLEDVFMRLVGQRMEDIEDDSAAAA